MGVDPLGELVRIAAVEGRLLFNLIEGNAFCGWDREIDRNTSCRIDGFFSRRGFAFIPARITGVHGDCEDRDQEQPGELAFPGGWGR